MFDDMKIAFCENRNSASFGLWIWLVARETESNVALVFNEIAKFKRHKTRSSKLLVFYGYQPTAEQPVFSLLKTCRFKNTVICHCAKFIFSVCERSIISEFWVCEKKNGYFSRACLKRQFIFHWRCNASVKKAARQSARKKKNRNKNLFDSRAVVIKMCSELNKMKWKKR